MPHAALLKESRNKIALFPQNDVSRQSDQSLIDLRVILKKQSPQVFPQNYCCLWQRRRIEHSRDDHK